MTTQTPAERLARQLIKRARIDERNNPKTPHTVTTHNTPTDDGSLLAASGDPYAAMTNATRRTVQPRRYIALTTRGWASPNDDDTNTPPSLHPKRRRVTLVVVHDTHTNTQTAAMHLDKQRALVIDHNAATGALRDALMKLAAELTTPPAA